MPWLMLGGVGKGARRLAQRGAAPGDGHVVLAARDPGARGGEKGVPGGRRRPPAALRCSTRSGAPARKGRHGRRAGALARHERAVNVAVRAPPARLLRRRAAAAAAAEPVPGDTTITRGVVVRPARAVVPADGFVGSDHSSFLPHVLILTTIRYIPVSVVAAAPLDAIDAITPAAPTPPVQLNQQR